MKMTIKTPSNKKSATIQRRLSAALRKGGLHHEHKTASEHQEAPTNCSNWEFIALYFQ